MFKSLYGAVGVAALCLGLAACSGGPTIVKCPEVRVLSELGNLTRFKPGDGRDITDVVMEAQFEEVRGECSVDDDEVEMAILIVLTARRGPASDVSADSFSMLAAVTDQRRKVLSRRIIPGQVDFSGNRARVSYLERLKIVIPKTEVQSGEDFIVFVGFELTRNEVEFNRAQRSF